jgi:hypothetical protein
MPSPTEESQIASIVLQNCRQCFIFPMLAQNRPISLCRDRACGGLAQPEFCKCFFP